MSRGRLASPPPERLIAVVGLLSAWLFGRLFRYCHGCDRIMWRRHRCPPMPAWVVLDLRDAAIRKARDRRDIWT